MKKIALLFIILCAGTLNGMEKLYVEEGISAYVKPVIITYLDKYNNLDDIVYAIKEDSLNKYNPELKKIVYGDNQKGFRELVHMLADKFNITTYIVAKKFDTPVADQFLNNEIFLNNELRKVIQSYHMVSSEIGSENILSKVDQLIKQGANVNFSWIGGDDRKHTILEAALMEAPGGHLVTLKKIIQLLLDAGAYAVDPDGRIIPREEVEKWLEELMKK